MNAYDSASLECTRNMGYTRCNPSGVVDSGLDPIRFCVNRV